MPSLSATFEPNIGPLLPIILTPPAVLHGARQPLGSNVAQQPLNVHTTMALIDTGASITSVTAALAQQVGLPIIGKRAFGTAGGIVAANVYLADIGIPFSAIPSGPVGQPSPPTHVPAVTVTSITVLEFQ